MDHNETISSGPQIEDGYTAIANELMDALCRVRVPGRARQVFDFIIRKTYGYSKKSDCISLSQFSKGTGLKKPHILQSIYQLNDMNMIVIKDGNGSAKTYGINKHYLDWKPLPKKVTSFVKKAHLRPFCYLCSFDKVYESHHIVPRAEGGSNRLENRINLCPNCHSLAHKEGYDREHLKAKKLEVESIIEMDNGFEQSVKKPLPKKVPTKTNNTKTTITKTKILSASGDAVREKEDFYLTKKKRKLTGKRLETFRLFWDAFAYKKGMAEAADAWIEIPVLTDQIVQKIVEAAKKEAKNRPDMVAQGRTPKMAQGWLSGKRWEDEDGDSDASSVRKEFNLD